jgi:hypothetical protein
MRRIVSCLLAALMFCPLSSVSADDYLQISGIYPHLATHNQVATEIGSTKHGESGIGAIVPWAGKLWYLTYPQHQIRGSNDKLYMVDDQLNLTVRPESIGGTHANRMIHRESQQLLMGYYCIDAEGNVRVCDPQQLVGRMTATMRHLKQPADKVYYFDMEGAIYEVNVHSLEVTKLFAKPFPGWHGKGAYTAQGRVVFANNGERAGEYKDLLVGGPATSDEEAGALVQWDGERDFEIIERLQFTDVTGPDGIHPGVDTADRPLWAMGWDRRSVILKLLDQGQWSTFRLPKASHTFDHRHGYYTEWPRIREILAGDPPTLMMVMHGSMFQVPAGFANHQTAGIRPLATHLRYIPDFCHWNDRLVLGADESSMMGNPMCGQAQSNLWFGTLDQLQRFGPAVGSGGVWRDDSVSAGEPSDPYLFAGFSQRVLHLKSQPDMEFTLQVDARGDRQWSDLADLRTGEGGYVTHIFDASAAGEWLRIVPRQDAVATAYLHYWSPRENRPDERAEFDSLADIDVDGPCHGGVIRPAAHNRSLQWLHKSAYDTDGEYLEVEIRDKHSLGFSTGEEDRSAEVRRLCSRSRRDFEVDRASVIVTMRDGRRFRLPKGSSHFDHTVLRGVREVQSERWLANLHGTFYEIPRASDNHSPDYDKIKPVSSHNKRIEDFCTWRGLLVMTGTKIGAEPDGHLFADDQGRGLWMGHVDELWKLGKPRGVGGPWYETEVAADEPSDPYLMTHYDRKRMELWHDAAEDVCFTIEIDFDHGGFSPYRQIRVAAGEKARYTFPEGFHAHWFRVRSDKPCSATVWCVYE